MFKNIPASVSGMMADMLFLAIEDLLAKPCAGTLRDLCFLPKAILGIPPNLNGAMRTGGLAERIQAREQKWKAGDRASIWEELQPSKGPARSNGKRPRSWGQTSSWDECDVGGEGEEQEEEEGKHLHGKERSASCESFTSEVLHLVLVGAIV